MTNNILNIKTNNQSIEIDLNLIFSTFSSTTVRMIDDPKFKRCQITDENHEVSILIDSFENSDIQCLFIRVNNKNYSKIKLFVNGRYRYEACAAGGWLAIPENLDDIYYWVPAEPMLRSVDGDGHILVEKKATILSFGTNNDQAEISFENNPECSLDSVFWKIPADEKDIINSLQVLSTLETQPFFLWGSHTPYAKPADIFTHLIYGNIYENRYAWPHRWKICSENDAHALYVTLAGLELATGNKLYSMLKDQIIMSVISRQSEDGGWYHGEWTHDMEAHYRLNASAIHTLLHRLEENDNSTVKTALEKAIHFIATKKDDTKIGVWFLHDELELNEKSMDKGPFAWLPSNAFGKSTPNMMVLNTHLDITIALEHYQRVTGDNHYTDLIKSARNATRVVLNNRPAELLYKALFYAINLTVLPTKDAAALPLPARILKRIAWKYITPNLHKVKTRYPRLVMPGGYIDRAINLQGWAFHYMTINTMDLIRYKQHFPDENLEEVLKSALNFTQNSGVRKRWQELRYEKYALGFWAEALYQLCHVSKAVTHRTWLAGAVLDLEDSKMGIPPSLLGCNAETIPVAQQSPCPMLTEKRIRVINLGSLEYSELLLVNSTYETVLLAHPNDTDKLKNLAWKDNNGSPIRGEEIKISPRSWILGTAK